MWLKLVALALASVLALLSASAVAHADNDATGGSAEWEVDDSRSDSGADVTGTLGVTDKTPGASGNAPDPQLRSIANETPEQLAARIRAFYDEQAARCRGMFTDAQSQASLETDGAAMLRNTYVRRCLASGSSDWKAPPSPPANPSVLAAEAVASLHIPNPHISIGPDPSINKWNMAFIGYPLWLWTEGPGRFTTTASVRGHSVVLTANRSSVQFGMGDGTVVTCSSTTPWNRSVTAQMHSPTCGHVYEEPSSPAAYRIRAVETWQVTWTALGQSGTMLVTVGSSRSVRVGELTAVIVPEGRP